MVVAAAADVADVVVAAAAAADVADVAAADGAAAAAAAAAGIGAVGCRRMDACSTSFRDGEKGTEGNQESRIDWESGCEERRLTGVRLREE